MAGANLKLVAMDGRAVRPRFTIISPRSKPWTGFEIACTALMLLTFAWIICGFAALLFAAMWALKLGITFISHSIGFAVV